MDERPGRCTPNRCPQTSGRSCCAPPRHGLSGKLEIDAELGVVVAADWKLDERLIEAPTLLELHADESAAAHTFHFGPPPVPT
jgi:hypothetical protein